MDADVIVIGAGAAGLAAARRLAARALRVIVVEARERVGGRAWSRQVARSAVPAELGAEFIHGPAPQTKALLREIGMAAIDTGGGSWMFTDGDLRPRSDDDSVNAASILKRASALNDDESVDRFLRRIESGGTAPEGVQTARSFAEGFDAVDPAIGSAQSIAAELQSGVDSVTARPLGGYKPMFEHLRSACAAAGVQTYFSTRVQRISWRRGDVRIEAESRGMAVRTLHARAVVVTLPVGVLRHTGDESEIVFDPALPVAKLDALDKLAMGQVARVVLSFKTAFWERIRDGRYRDAAFFRGTEQAFAVYWTQLPVRTEHIVAWAGGPKATALGGLSADSLIDRALEGFGTLLNEATCVRKEFEGAAMHDWGRDPFARGAYSYVLVGGADARAGLAAPVDEALFFAGEATSGDGQGGTVNGALETGDRAAHEAATALGVTAR